MDAVLKRDYAWLSNALWRSIELCLLSNYPWEAEERVLDLGCGDGFVTSILFDGKGIDVIGTDYILRYLKSCSKKHGFYKGILCSDARRLPFKERTFSAVLSNCVIEHIPDVRLVLAEVNRVLKHGGRFIFTVPTPQFGRSSFLYRALDKLGLSRLAEYYVLRQNKRVYHANIMNHEGWANMLRKEGFIVRGCIYYMKPHTAKSFENMEMLYWLGIGKFRLNALTAKTARGLEKIGICWQRKLISFLFRESLAELVSRDLNSPGPGAACCIVAEKA